MYHGGPVASPLRLPATMTATRTLLSLGLLPASASYLHRRNVRLLGEVKWDVERCRGRFATGLMTAF